MSNQPRLRVKYEEEVKKALMEKFQYKSVMQIPRIEKVCLNQGVGAATCKTNKSCIDFCKTVASE